MADCKTYREEIEELAGVGRLGLEARAHVNACEACRHLEQERASLRRLVRSLETVAAPADFEFRLRARMDASRAKERRNPLRPVYGFAALAAAACFLVVSASLYFRQEQQRRPDAGQRQAGIARSAGGAARRSRDPGIRQCAGSAPLEKSAELATRLTPYTREELDRQFRESALRQLADRNHQRQVLNSVTSPLHG